MCEGKTKETTMNMRNHFRTLTLASMLAFSVMSPLAVHVHAEAADPSSTASVPGDCTADQKYQSEDGKTNYSKGDNIPSGARLHAVDPAGNVNQNATYKCEHGNINPALILPTSRHLPVAAPFAGAFGR
jgi:hypothetical protein